MMARVAPLKIEDLPEYKELFEMVEAIMGFIPNSMLTMARRPEIMNGFAGLAMAVNGPGTVDGPLKNLISEVASKAAGCTYCVAHTSHVAHRAGVSQEKLDDIWSFETSPHYSEAERAALMLAMKASQVPNLAGDSDFTELRKHYSDEQIVEIMGVISLFGFLNRWNDSMATALEAVPLDYASATNPGGSWEVGKHAK
jgi:uncharacterized peroxidase-related enzyme